MRRKNTTSSLKQAPLTRIAGGAVIIHTTAESAPSPPSCFGEVTVMAAYLLATRLKKPDEAVAFAERAVAIAPRSGEIKDTLAWVRHLTGDNRAAASIIEEALKLNPSASESHVHAASIYIDLRDRAAAERALREALRLQPALASREDVQRLQADLKRLTSGPPQSF